MTTFNITQLQGIKSKIEETLTPLITKDYCLLDVPSPHPNIGDHLIWAGELAFLSNLKQKLVYSSNFHLFQENRIPSDCIILLHGGGNFGDVWRLHQQFRIDVIKRFKEHKIIIFPQTVYYSNEKLLMEDAAIFNEHPDLTICVRDEVSYALLKKHFLKNTILLVPDMAFCLDFSERIKVAKSPRTLILKRNDKELNTNINLAQLGAASGNKVDVMDWPTFNISGLDSLAYRLKNKVNVALSNFLIKIPVLRNMVDPRYGIIKLNEHERLAQIGIDFLNQYDLVYTTRLHVFILSILLDKKAIMIDNSYGKNSQFYNAWLSDFENVSLMAKK